MSSLSRLFCLAAACGLVSACQNGQNSGAGGSDNPYVSNFGNDGGYNPYPGQPGAIQSGSYSPPPTTSAPPTYTTPPMPENDPYAFNAASAPAPTTKPRTAASSSGGSAKKSTASASKGKARAPIKKSGSYTVAKGDTLYGIAKKRGSTVAKIKAANGLSSDLIRPGQALKIP